MTPTTLPLTKASKSPYHLKTTPSTTPSTSRLQNEKRASSVPPSKRKKSGRRLLVSGRKTKAKTTSRGNKRQSSPSKLPNSRQFPQTPAAPKPIHLLFRNYTDYTVSIHWLDNTGTPHLYYHLLSGHEQPQRTYQGHFWVIRDSRTNNLLRKYKVPSEKMLQEQPEGPIVGIYEKEHLKVVEKMQQEHEKQKRKLLISVPNANGGTGGVEEASMAPADAENTSQKHTHKRKRAKRSKSVESISLTSKNAARRRATDEGSTTSSLSPQQKRRPHTSGSRSRNASSTGYSSSRRRASQQKQLRSQKSSQNIPSPSNNNPAIKSSPLYVIQTRRNSATLLQVRASPYDTLLETLQEDNQMFLDQDFPPMNRSVGNKVSHTSWSRLSELCPGCQLFPDDGVHEEEELNIDRLILEQEQERQHYLDRTQSGETTTMSPHGSTQTNGDNTAGNSGRSQASGTLPTNSSSNTADPSGKKFSSPLHPHSRSDAGLHQYPSEEKKSEETFTVHESSTAANGRNNDEAPSSAQSENEPTGASQQQFKDNDSEGPFSPKTPFIEGTYCDLRNLSQGHFSLSWLTGAICAVASENMSSIRKLIHGDSRYGIYSVVLHYLGRKVVIIVDDYVPVDAAGMCSFSRPLEHRYIWPCILEKAFAKLLGSYSALAATQGSQRDLHEFNTSSVVSSLLGGKARWMYWGKDDVTGKETRSLIRDHFLWTTLLKEKRVLVLTPKSNCQLGLVPFHGYHLLDVMHIERVRGTLDDGLSPSKSGRARGRRRKAPVLRQLNLFLIRNSYGKSSWHGKWSQQDKIWRRYPEVRDNLYLEDDEDGSLFWMELSDVRKNFEVVWFN